MANQDFTQGSGWEYEINGSYPGVGMDALNLQPGDVLTLRYTLAYGWDIGNGYGSLGNAVGYCVTYYGGGSWSGVNHDTEEVTEDGVTKTVCRRCGLASEGGLCSHRRITGNTSIRKTAPARRSARTATNRGEAEPACAEIHRRKEFRKPHHYLRT